MVWRVPCASGGAFGAGTGASPDTASIQKTPSLRIVQGGRLRPPKLRLGAKAGFAFQEFSSRQILFGELRAPVPEPLAQALGQSPIHFLLEIRDRGEPPMQSFLSGFPTI